jgi:hypothetical protein
MSADDGDRAAATPVAKPPFAAKLPPFWSFDLEMWFQQINILMT